MRFVVFESVEVLVPFAAYITAVRFFFLHTKGARVRNRRLRVDDGESSVGVVMELLIVVTMLDDTTVSPTEEAGVEGGCGNKR